MRTETIKLTRLHPAQEQIRNERARFNVLACGRRFGKTTMIVDLLAETSISGYPACYFAPTYKMMSEVWREMSTTLRPIASRVSAQERRLELITGGVVDMWSLDQPNAARGRKYKRVAVDEAGMVKDLQTAWEQVIRPTLADYEGDAWFPGTPKGPQLLSHDVSLGTRRPAQRLAFLAVADGGQPAH